MTRTQVAVVLLCGVAAAVVLGKVGPVAEVVSGRFGVTLSAIGWLASGVTVVAALLAVPVGRWAARRRPGRLLVVSMAILGAAGLGSSAAGTGWLLFALRFAEGLGFVGVVVLAPALLASVADPRRRQTGLALWGACIPLGLAVASAAGGVVGAGGWRVWFAVVAFAATGLAVAAAGLPASADPSGPRDAGRARLPGAVWLLGVGFMLIASMGVALVSMFPMFLSIRHATPPAAAGLATSLVAVASVAGSLLAAALLHRGINVRWLFAAGLVMPVAAGGVFLGAPAWPAVGSAAALMVLNGVAVSAVFAVVPAVAGSGAATAAGTGVLTQLGSLGTLLGTPALATAADHLGWWAGVPLFAVLATAGVTAAGSAAHGTWTPLR